MERKEPIRYRAKEGVMRLGPPYDGMVARLHDLVLALLVPAREGNRQGVLVCAERVQGQCGALVELLNLRITNDELRSKEK